MDYMDVMGGHWKLKNRASNMPLTEGLPNERETSEQAEAVEMTGNDLMKEMAGVVGLLWPPQRWPWPQQ